MTFIHKKRIARVVITCMVLAAGFIASAPAQATTDSILWFKQVGTDSSVRPASEPSGSLVREGTFNKLGAASTTLETQTITCSTGTNPHWNAPFDPYEVAVDTTNNKIYWHNSFEPAIVMSNLDGTGCERIIQDDYYTAAGIALDVTNQMLYSIYVNTIRKNDIAAKSRTTLTITGDSFTAADRPEDLVLDGSTLYVSTNTSSAGSGRIVKINLNTLVATNLITGRDKGMEQIALDTANNKIYWANRITKTLNSATLSDGSNIQTLRTSSKEIWSVAIDAANSKLYIGEIGAGAAAIVKTDLDGTNAVSTGFVTVTFLTIAGTGSGGGSGGSGGSSSGSSSSSSQDDAARKEADRLRHVAIMNARKEIVRKVSAHIDVLSTDLAAAEAAPLTTPRLTLANSRLSEIDTSTPITYARIEAVINKYKIYDQIAGNINEPLYARQLVDYAIIDKQNTLKSLTLSQLMDLPAESRDSIEEINQFFADAIAQQKIRKAHLDAVLERSRTRD